MGNHEKMFGICENKCLVEVSPKTDTDDVKKRVEVLETDLVQLTEDHGDRIGAVEDAVIEDIDSSVSLADNAITIELTRADGVKKTTTSTLPTGSVTTYVSLKEPADAKVGDIWIRMEAQ